ncbi:MAG: hypothetical protein NC396_07980 [Bacteroides sp.]|nr:hypothetical protein [Bacteroides sp.]MCM1086272.1 hypothetical protein [Bacteroides sp.]
MKKLIVFVLLLAPTFSFVKAQDVIVLRNADEIQAKVLEISGTSVKYVDWDFQDGPARVVDKSEVFFIKYQNGKKEVFSEVPAPAALKVRGKYIHRIKPQGYVYFGTAFSVISNDFYDDVAVGPALDASVGARIYDYFFIGAEVGYNSIFEKLSFFDMTNVYEGWVYYHNMSAGINMKGYYPVSKKFFPFLNLGFAAEILAVDDKIHNSASFRKKNSDMPKTYNSEHFGFFQMQVGAGVDYGRLSCGIGYKLLNRKELNRHFCYIKVGVRL